MSEDSTEQSELAEWRKDQLERVKDGSLYIGNIYK